MKWIILLVLCSCADDKFRKVEELKNDFRILAVIATNPEVAPGGTSTLTLLVTDPLAGGRTINGTSQSCIDPGISLGAPVSCAHDPSASEDPLTLLTSAPDLQNNFGTGIVGSVPVNVPAGIFLGRSAREQSNGVAFITIFRFNVDGREVKAFKRVIATNRNPRNDNPVAGAISVSGGGVRKPSKDDELTVSSSAPEVYDFVNVDGSIQVRAEETDVAWYVSSGELNRPKTDLGQEVKYIADPPSGAMLILAVIRDERGGVAVVRENVP